MLAAGCAAKKEADRSSSFRVTGTAGRNVNTNAALMVTPGAQLSGRVSSVNPIARFVIATFPLGTMPAKDQKLNVYRDGLKVAVVKITGPQRDVNIAADIVAGECRVGDEIKND